MIAMSEKRYQVAVDLGAENSTQYSTIWTIWGKSL